MFTSAYIMAILFFDSLSQVQRELISCHNRNERQIFYSFYLSPSFLKYRKLIYPPIQHHPHIHHHMEHDRRIDTIRLKHDNAIEESTKRKKKAEM